MENLQRYVQLPRGQEQLRAVAAGFSSYGFPNVYGTIDGTYINFVVPSAYRTDYFTRKYTTSVNLTCLCDSSKLIQYLTVGFSARCHDSNIFKSSSLGRMIFNKHLISPQYHIKGTPSINVMVPYPGANLSPGQERYNTLYSSTRMVVEDLKSRWMRLQGLECDLEFANKVIDHCLLCTTSVNKKPGHCTNVYCTGHPSWIYQPAMWGCRLKT